MCYSNNPKFIECVKELNDERNYSSPSGLFYNTSLSLEDSYLNESYASLVSINNKLTDEDVDEIIELLEYTYQLNGQIARQFGVEVHLLSCQRMFEAQGACVQRLSATELEAVLGERLVRCAACAA